jgi:hypothetical protein
MKHKRIMKFLMGVMTVTMMLGMPVFASDMSVVEGTEIVEDGGEQTREEAFMWFYRTHNGIRQKRLWSLTYGHWVTDWIDIGPA